jgi:hypothetical protein
MSASYVSFRRSENKLKQARLRVAMGRIGFANNGPNLHHPFLCESAQTDTRNRPPYQMPRGLRVTRHGTGKFCFSKKKSLENARPRCDSRARRAVTRALGSLRPIYMRGARKFRKQLRAREGTEPTSLPATQA